MWLKTEFCCKIWKLRTKKKTALLSLLVVLLFYITRCTYVSVCVCVCVCVWIGCLFGIISSIPYSQTQSSSLQTSGRDRTMALNSIYANSFCPCYSRLKKGVSLIYDPLSYPCIPDEPFLGPIFLPFCQHYLILLRFVCLSGVGGRGGGWFYFMHGSYLQKKGIKLILNVDKQPHLC